MPTLEIAGRTIGGGAAPFVIAEAGVNHNGDIDLAHQLVDAAADAGAEAVKFQTFTVDELVTATAPKAAYQNANVGAAVSQRDMLRALELPMKAHADLRDHAARRGIVFMSSPFDEASVDALVDLGVPAIKIPSGELTHHALLRRAARSRLPLVVSTGMATLAEIDDAVAAIRSEGPAAFTLLHCLSSYPADPAEINLRAMAGMAQRYGVPVGYSDHTIGIAVAIAAGALGASVIEKHLTLDCALPGPDHKASLEPDQFRAMVEGLRAAHRALGDGVKRPMPSELSTIVAARKSVVTTRGLAAGSVLTEDMLAVRRPGNGIPPAGRAKLVGLRLRRDVGEGHLLSFDDVEEAGA